MPSIPCINKVEPSGRCVCDDLPLSNLSSADQDRRIFISYAPIPPIYLPEPGDLTNPGVTPVCVSIVSQEVADNCAGNATVPGTPDPIPNAPTDPNQPPDTPPQSPGDPNSTQPTLPGVPHDIETGYWNTQSNCIAFCPDHSSSAVATIPEHTYLGVTQFEADMLSSNACIALARSRLVCFTPPSEGTIVKLCADTPQTVTCVVTGAVSIELVGLPTGMTSSCDGNGLCTITGTPSCGNYTVTVNVVSQFSGPVSFNFTIKVLGVTCPATTAYRGNAYSAAATGCGGTAPYVFTPASAGGLSIDASGLITGIPSSTCTPPDTYSTITLPITVTDADGTSCTKNCDIRVEDCSCVNWDPGALTYESSPPSYSPPGFAFASQSGLTYSLWSSHQDPGDPPSSAGVALVGVSGSRTGQCCCRATINVTGTNMNDTGLNDNYGSMAVQISGVTVASFSWTGPVTNGTVDFTVPSGIADVKIYVNAQCGPGTPPTGAKTQSGSVVITNVKTGAC